MTDPQRTAAPEVPEDEIMFDATADSARDAFARFPAGVAVVTATGDDGSPHGLTVSSVASHSMDPPTVSFNVATTSWTGRALRSARHLAVHLLAADQEPVARRFAARVSDRFAGLDWEHGDDGVPVLRDALAVLACRRTAMFVHGDHAIILGQVVGTAVNGGQPLMYHRRGYRPLDVSRASPRDRT